MKRIMRQGFLLGVIIALVAILSLGAFFLSRGTFEQGRQTLLTRDGLHARFLAEAALNKALRLFQDNLNDPAALDPGSSADSPAIRLRMPLPVSDSASGKLNTTSIPEFTYLKAAVAARQPYEEVSGLDRLFSFMMDGRVASYDVRVTCRVEEAFRVAAETSQASPILGVDMPWNIRKDVREFLEGKGYVSFFLQFPPDMVLFDFTLPIEAFGFKIFSIDICALVDKVIIGLVNSIGGRVRQQLDDFIPGGNQNGYLKTLSTLDFLARILMNRIIAPNANPPVYPIRKSLDLVPFPKSPEVMWPSGALSANAAKDRTTCLEKVGTMLWRAEASLSFPDGHTTTRSVEGRKDFRVADVEPPAPMYSFFVLNKPNERLAFNDAGGDLLVNNHVYAGAKGESGSQTSEVPGLIRVNFANGQNGVPLSVKTSLLGNPFAGHRSPIDAEDNAIKSMIRGTDVLLVLDASTNMTMMGGETTCTANFDHCARNPSAPLEDTFAGRKVALIDSSQQDEKNAIVQKQFGEIKLGNPKVKERLEKRFDAFSKYERPDATISDAERRFQNWYSSKQKMFRYVALLNFIPDLGALSVHPAKLLVSLARLALFGSPQVQSWTAGSFMNQSDCFVPWEMPYFGTSWRGFTMPIPPWNTGSTHLFGAGAMHPTLTREIEGKVVKTFRQWKMCICGLQPTDVLWVGAIRVPPVPTPFWYTGIIQNKYGYNFLPLKSFDASAGEIYDKIKEYDPEEPANGVPNLYSSVQYARKASLFFDSWQDFRTDLEKRLVQTASGQWVVPLNGITYITGNLGTTQEYFFPRVPAGYASAGAPIPDLWVAGRGMIVCSGNAYLNCSIRMLEEVPATGASGSPPLFTLMARNGGLMLKNTADGGQQYYRIDGSVYTDLGIMVPSGSSLRILGNWVTNRFPRAALRGTTVIDYLSSRVRSSLGSLHPETGRLDPTRYYGTLSPTWVAWQEK